MEQWTLPKGWEWVKLASLVTELESGRRPKGGVNNITTGVPSISGEHMTSDGRFDFSKLRYVPPEFAKTLLQGWILQEDILVVKDGATTGKVSFIDQSFPFEKAIVNEHVFILRFNRDQISPKYIFYFLFCDFGQAMIRALSKGAAIGGINRQFVHFVSIPIPYPNDPARSLAEQRRIVAYLEALQDEVSAARQSLEEDERRVSELEQSILAAAFRGEI